MPAPVLYLHGFASSPRGDKPVALARILGRHGIELNAPDLNVPSFEALDFEAMVERALEQATPAPSAIVGSSLGCAVALAGLRRGLSAPAVLIAPAFGISDLWISRLPAGDRITVWNHARNENATIHRAFFEQMSRLEEHPDPPEVPVVVFMGTEDESIPYERVAVVWKRWEESGRLHPRSRFITVPGGDHRLVDQIDRIGEEIRALVGAS